MLKRRSHLLFMVVFFGLVLQNPSGRIRDTLCPYWGEGSSSHLGTDPDQPRCSNHSEPCDTSGRKEILGKLPHPPGTSLRIWNQVGRSKDSDAGFAGRSGVLEPHDGVRKCLQQEQKFF